MIVVCILYLSLLVNNTVMDLCHCHKLVRRFFFYLLPKVAGAQMFIVDFSIFHPSYAGSDSVTEYSFLNTSGNCDTSIGFCILVTLICGFHLALKKNILLAESRILQQTSKLSASKSALGYEWTILTVFRFDLLTSTKSS